MGLFAFTTHLSHGDIERLAARADLAAATPVLHAAAEARAQGADALCVPLTTERWRARWRDLCLLPPGDCDQQQLERRAESWRAQPAFARDEVTLTRLDEAEGACVMVSDWLELDAPDDWVRHDAEIALQQELAYASYLNVQTAILPPPRNRAHVADYARTVNNCIHAVPYIQLAVRMPIYDPLELQLSPGGSSSSAPAAGASTATWEMWDCIRSICDYSPRLALTLDMTTPMPSVLSILAQWSAEPVKHIFLPSSAFIPNKRGYPVLPKGAQAFLKDMVKLRPNIILSGTAAGRHQLGGEKAYMQYIRHLEENSPIAAAYKTAGTVENFAQGYQDYLQAPLQPLMDNLQSFTYNTFEQDPVKYRQYEEAVTQALSEWPQSENIVICVAGAGRGPLVARCLNALERTKRVASVYAIEKNPNAWVTLQDRKQREWGDKVQLVFGDMRAVEVPPVDILVSELLGSFGDNELSPECLDGAMRFLKPEGISIPSTYTAHLAPLSSSKLYNEARAGKDDKALETPYVVMMEAMNILSGNGGGVSGNCGPTVQECWDFEHPRSDVALNARGLPFTNTHNARSAKLAFHIPHAGILHGLAGYFEAVLYGGIGLSIHPERMEYISKDMLSWFPLFFPLKEPMYLPSNSELHVSIWRLTNQRQVWYEWYAEAFLSTPHAPSLGATNALAVDVETTPMISPSPLADAIDIPRIETEDVDAGSSDGERRVELVKIGQTSLHNPRGRSSWIGL